MNKEEVLSVWKESIKDFKKLSFPEAKELYLVYKKETNAEKKIEIRNKIIEGSLHIVINHIENSLYSKLNQNCYDINDIINAFIIAWSEELCSDKILNYSAYSNIYSSNSFCKKVADNIFGDYFLGHNEFMNRVHLFEKQFNIYVNILKNSPDIGYSSDEEHFVNESIKRNCYDETISIKKLLSFFDSIINSFDCDINEIKFEQTNIALLKHLLLKNGFENFYNATSEAVYNNLEAIFERFLFNERLKNIVLNSGILTDNERAVIKYRYGLTDEDPLTLEQIHLKLNVTRERVRQLEVKALHKLKIFMSEVLNINVDDIKDEPTKLFTDVEDKREISEEEYKVTVNSYGKLVANKVNKYNEKYGRYPTWDEIKDEISLKNITPKDVIIDTSGSIYISQIYIKGVKFQDISCSVSNVVTTNKDLLDDETKDNNTDNIEVQDNKKNKITRESIIESLKDWPAYYNHLGYEYKNDIEIIKLILSVNPNIIYYHLPSLDACVYDNEDIMIEFIDDEKIYNKMSDRLKSNPKFLSDAIKKGKFAIYSYLSDDMKKTKAVIEVMLEINPEYYMQQTKIQNYNVDVLEYIFDYQQMGNAVKNGCYKILKLYKKLMLQNGYISIDEYINTIIQLIKGNVDIATDIYNNLPMVTKMNKDVVITCLNIDLSIVEDYLNDITNKYGDDEEIMKIIISNRISYFRNLSSRLKCDSNYMLSFENNNPNFVIDLYNTYRHDIVSMFLYFTSPRTFGQNLAEIVRTSSCYHNSIYFYLKIFSRSEMDFIRLYIKLIKKLPSLVRSCPDFLKQDELMYIYVNIYENKAKYINNLRSFYGYPQLDFSNISLDLNIKYPEYDEILRGFSEKGILIVKRNNLYGVIDANTNEVIIPCLYEEFMDSYNAWNEKKIAESNNIDSKEKKGSYQRTKK